MNRRLITAILIMAAIPLTGAGVDIYVPSLPAISHYFSTSRQYVQLSLTIYIFTYGLAQLFWGTLSDSLGRKRVLNIGLILFTFSSYLATLAPNIDALLMLRAFQGIAVAAIGATTRAILRDLYDGSVFRKMMGYFTLAWAVGPVFSPLLGGYLQQYIGWQASFYFLAAYSVFCVILSVLSIETVGHRHELNMKTVVSNFRVILSNPVFWGWTLISAFMYLMIIMFNTVGPFLVQVKLNYSAATYGYVAFFLGLAWMLGNFISRFLVRYEAHGVVRNFLVAAVVISFLIFVLSIFQTMTLLSLVVPVLFLIITVAVIFASSFGGPIMLFPKMAGTASSAMGAITATSVGVLGSFSVLLKTSDQTPMLAVFAGFMIVSLLIYTFLVGKHIQKSTQCKEVA